MSCTDYSSDTVYIFKVYRSHSRNWSRNSGLSNPVSNDHRLSRSWDYSRAFSSSRRTRLELCDATCVRESTRNHRRFHRRAHARARARARTLVHRFSRYLAPALIKPIHRRRRRSKPVSYGGPLNTGWRVKSVVKIINGSSARAFALSPIDGATAGCIRQRGHNTQRSVFLFPSSFFFVLLLLSLFLPSKWRTYFFFIFLFFY